CTNTGGNPAPPASNFFDIDTTQNNNLGSVNLTPATGYDCQFVDSYGRLVGQIKWVPGTPGNLYVSGTMFFDGSLNWTGHAIYHGRATIYFAGALNFSTNGAYLCGTNSSCNTSWDTTNDLLVLVGGSNAQSPSLAFTLTTNY